MSGFKYKTERDYYHHYNSASSGIHFEPGNNGTKIIYHEKTNDYIGNV